MAALAEGRKAKHFRKQGVRRCVSAARETAANALRPVQSKDISVHALALNLIQFFELLLTELVQLLLSVVS